MVGALLLVLSGLALVVGSAAGRRSWSDRVDRWTAGSAAVLALLGAVVAVSTVGAAIDTDELPVFLAFAVAPLLLAAVPLILGTPTTTTTALTALCAVLLVAHVVVTGLSIGLLFAPAAITLILLAAARARRPV